MKTFSQKKLCLNSPSFALISVLALVSLAALTATAFLASARLERQATGSIGSSTRLEMALNSGKACAAQVINDNSQADVGGNTHIVTYWRTNWTDELGYPFIGQTKASGTNGQLSAKWYYFPLFSPAGVTNLDTNVIQTAMRFTNGHQGTFSNDMQTFMTGNATNGFVGNPGLNHPICVQIPLLGGRTSPPVGWVYLNQEKRKLGSALTNTSPAVRIAWFTEDLEGLIDAERMGASTLRATGTNSEEISLTSATDTNGSQIIASISTFTNARKAFISYGLLASSNVSGITNSTNARYFASGLRTWAPTNPASPNNGALAWIPAGIPVGGTAGNPRGYTNQGYTKFNLNNLATNSGSVGQAVTNIAGIITANLSTKFLARAGGLTNSILYTPSDFDYAKCLAANIIDYIDADSIPTALDAAEGYRGTEALPYLTELSLRYRLEPGDGGYSDYKDSNNVPIVVPTPANRIRPSINAYLELWNPYPTNIPVSSLGISFKSYGTNLPTSANAFAIGCNQFNTTIDTIAANYKNGSSGSLSNLTFTFSTAIAAGMVKGITGNSLSSNGYCLIKLDHDQDWINIGPLNDTNNWRRRSATRFEFIYGRGNSTTKEIYVGANSSTFSNACMVVGAPGIGTAYRGYGRSGLCELSFGGIVYDRARNLLMQYSSFQTDGSSPNSGAQYQSWQPSLIISDPSSYGDRLLNSGDPRITYFLRPNNSSDALFAHLAFDNTSFGGPNTNTQTAHPTKSLSTNTSFLNPSCRLDVTQWSDQGHNPTAYGANPTGANPQTNSANEPIQQTPVSTGATHSPAFIRNGPMTNIFELGNIYDPILWRGVENGNITSNSIADPRFGGGNTLRIGRPEHPRFAFTNMYGNSDPSIPNMAQSSAALLDLFCLTNGTSISGGPYSMGGGKINLNTAPAPVLRALAGGILLTNDPAQAPPNHTIPPDMAEAFAQGVMRFRSKYPFLTPSHLSFIGTDPTWPNTNSWPTNSVFGNTNTIALSTVPGSSLGTAKINVTGWNDQAAEEWFSKIYALSSCQSHNYRVYVVAQLVATNSSGQTNAIGPLVKKFYQIYSRNGSSAASLPDITTYPNNTIYSWKASAGVIDIYKSAY
jgi:type II secretory pathway component PulK